MISASAATASFFADVAAPADTFVIVVLYSLNSNHRLDRTCGVVILFFAHCCANGDAPPLYATAE